MRFVKENAFMDEFLFCQEMKERTRAKDVFHLVNAFLRENSIAWNKVGSVCADGAPATIGHRSGFVAPLKQIAPHIVSNHCAIHKYALAFKTLSLELKSALDSVVKAVNFIRGRTVNSRLFKAFCDFCAICTISDFFTNQQPPQRGGAVPDPVWVGSKWLLAFPRVPVAPGTRLHFFAMLLP